LAQSVFDFMQYIKQHYEFYSLMYNFRSDKFRNDYALSIALQTLTGYSSDNFSVIPGNLDTIVEDTTVMDIVDNKITLLFPSTVTRNMCATQIKHTSIHFLNKRTLFEHSTLEKLQGTANA